MKPVNLNTARKAKLRAEKTARGNRNAVKFGLSKARKTAAKRETERSARNLDGHKQNT